MNIDQLIVCSFLSASSESLLLRSSLVSSVPRLVVPLLRKYLVADLIFYTGFLIAAWIVLGFQADVLCVCASTLEVTKDPDYVFANLISSMKLLDIIWQVPWFSVGISFDNVFEISCHLLLVFILPPDIHTSISSMGKSISLSIPD